MTWPEIYGRLKSNRGDREAYGVLEHYVRAWARPSLWRHGWQVVEDVVADTCSTVVLDFDKAHGPQTFKGFVLGLYLNVRRRLVGHAPDMVSIESVDLPETTYPTPNHDELELLRRCFNELPARERLAVMLRFFEDAGYKVIAAALKVTEVNARQIVFTGIRRLRACGQRTWPLGRG